MSQHQLPVILFYPFDARTNQYTNIQKSIILSLDYTVKPLTSVEILKAFFKPSVCILNWFESKIAGETGRISVRGCLYFLWYLLLLLLSNTKIIWVRHNHLPHTAQGASAWLARRGTALLSMLAKHTVVHTPCRRNRERYIPHPLYSYKPPEKNCFNKALQFIYVGRIMPYKGLDALIQAWPKNIKLRIYGECKDHRYAQELQRAASQREIDVELHLRFVDEEELKYILSNADVMLLPHRKKTALVSGSYFLAKTFGLIIIAARSDLAPSPDYYTLIYGGTNSVGKAIRQASLVAADTSKTRIFCFAKEVYGIEEITRLWSEIIVQSHERR